MFGDSENTDIILEWEAQLVGHGEIHVWIDRLRTDSKDFEGK